MPRKRTSRPAATQRLQKRFKASELRAKLGYIKAQLTAGKPDLEIAESMNLSAKVYNDLRKELMRQETESMYAKTPEEVYLDYKWKTLQCVEDIDRMIEQFHTSKQYNAFVGAIRTKSDLLDKIIKTGQDMGMVKKAAASKLVIHGVALHQMDNADLRHAIVKETQQLAAAMKQFDFVDMKGRSISMGDDSSAPALPPGIIDVPNPPEFSANGQPKESKGSAKKSRNSRKARTVQRTKSLVKPEASELL